MADETENVAGAAGSNAAADALALGGASREKADAYLEEQLRFARLQSQNLIEQNAFELSHLRWRRLNDQLSGALRIILVVLGLAVLAGLAVLLWNASEADGLIVDSFSAPADFAARGVGGDVLANDITNRLAHIRAVANANSISNSSDVSKNGEDDIKADIPDTGVSLGEVWRLLRRWLGNEQHLTGSLRELPDGKIALHAVFADGTLLDATGPAGDLDALEQNLAEQAFAHFDPSNTVLYLWAIRGSQAALRQAERNALGTRGRQAQATGYSLWSNVTRGATGDIPLSIQRIHISLALDPRLQAAHGELAIEEHLLGHDEIALAEERAAAEQIERDQPRPLQGAGYVEVHNGALQRIAEMLGDFDAAERVACGPTCIPDNLSAAALYAARRHDLPAARAFLHAAQASGKADPVQSADAAYYIAMGEDDGRSAAALVKRRMASQAGSYSAGYLAVVDRVETHPMVAMALALAGDAAGARRIADMTPADCYPCQIARASAATAAKDWARADFWFAHATALAPSLPFAYTDWGMMLLAKGDYDAAIAKFGSAHDKGPHFADPLEGWGEALIAKNRSDLALPKFEEAAKYAPNWQRLHQKWGEALKWSGDSDGAKKQFALARNLAAANP
jgi:tetratricopeptide (TPR) repeat protein